MGDAVTLDFSKSQPVAPPGGVQLDFSKAERLASSQKAAPNAGLAPPAGAPPSRESLARSIPTPGALDRGATALGAQLPSPGDVGHMMNDKPIPEEGDSSIFPEAVSRAGRGWYQSTIAEPAERIHEGDYAGAAGEAIPGIAQAASLGRGIFKAIPEEVSTAPIRAGARTIEGVANSSPMRYVRGASRLFTPADDARKMIRIPGRDFGLDVPSNPGAPFPERPLPAVMQARGLQTGGQAIAEPSTALARIPVTAAEPEETALTPSGKIGGRYVLMPEEVQRANQIGKIAKARASERGMQYAAGMRPSGAKIAAP